MEEQIKEIISKVAKMFHRYGIKSVSMDDVARELSMSKKTLYKLFKDKEDLVTQVLNCPAHDEFKNLPKDAKLNAVEKHIMVYKSIVKFLTDLNPSFEYDLKKYYPKLYLEVIQKRRDRIFQNMKSDLTQGIAEGFFRPDLDVEIITIINIMRIESLQTTDVMEVFNHELLDVVKEFFSYHFYAIATAKGLEEYKRLIKIKNHE